MRRCTDGTFQGILRIGGKPLGVLVVPSLEVSGDLQALGLYSWDGSQPAPLQVLQLVFEQWQPAADRGSKAPPRPAAPLCVPLDERLRESELSITVFGLSPPGEVSGGGSRRFALPDEYRALGRDIAASLSLHLQRADYVRAQHERHAGASGTPLEPAPDVCNQSVFTVHCGTPEELPVYLHMA